ncbi:UDP-glucose/GDP-mannose dehydrogenase family protein, partial [Francisella tularensis subsp. holarctica]|nr:UDP-glucose/GDP-mannose dehydrogenase family protein [Francisella tularensis subsp. holarctica]
ATPEYGRAFDERRKMVNLDAIIMAVSHEQFKDITKQQFDRLYAHNSRKIIFDIKGSLDKSEFVKDYIYWRF